jgi:hypothetical protein
MRAALFALAVLLFMTGGLIAQAVWDSAIGAWIGIGGVVVLVLLRVLSFVPGLPDLWPFDGE